MDKWTQAEAIELCIALERIAPDFGAHIGLTGELLYKKGERKDCDILVYRIRQVESIDADGMFEAFKAAGVEKTGGFGWCHKATWQGKPIDFFFPEESGDYPDFNAKQHVADMCLLSQLPEHVA